MVLSKGVQWWEEWQLRILVLTSLFLQYFLFLCSLLRKRSIPSWFRFFIWLAYLGSEAVAIYALAALFNHHTKQEWISTHSNSVTLEALWAPILLIHLGGQNGITAYNIEDNELWRRHVLTAMSQVAVAIYVFCKSWSGDKRILQAAIILFVTGIIKCWLKPWDLKRVSINSLVDSSGPPEENDYTSSLHQFVQDATMYFQFDHGRTPCGCGYQGFAWRGISPELNHIPRERSNNVTGDVWKPYKLCVDLAPSYPHRLVFLRHFVHNVGSAHRLLQSSISKTFDRLYTKEAVLHQEQKNAPGSCANLIRHIVTAFFAFTAIGLFHHRSNTDAYNSIDVKVTYTLLCCTAALESFMPGVSFIASKHQWLGERRWPDEVAQYNLIGYLARNKKHRMLRKVTTLLVCKNYLDQLWCMKPSKSSSDLTNLIHGYILKGWNEHHINDVSTYRAFNENRGKWTIRREQCTETLVASIQRPFDESVLLWHLATDFCFHLTEPPPSHEVARRCREISNYMSYLLFINPEMLITGGRRSVFRAAYKKLKGMLKEVPALDEKELAHKIIHQAKDSTEGSTGIVDDAWRITKDLINIHREDEEKMWRVIQGVWVEMLCFSAGRCRGYLHAKSLGNGGEYLSFVWFLLTYMVPAS